MRLWARRLLGLGVLLATAAEAQAPLAPESKIPVEKTLIVSKNDIEALVSKRLLRAPALQVSIWRKGTLPVGLLIVQSEHQVCALLELCRGSILLEVDGTRVHGLSGLQVLTDRLTAKGKVQFRVQQSDEVRLVTALNVDHRGHDDVPN